MTDKVSEYVGLVVSGLFARGFKEIRVTNDRQNRDIVFETKARTGTGQPICVQGFKTCTLGIDVELGVEEAARLHVEKYARKVNP